MDDDLEELIVESSSEDDRGNRDEDYESSSSCSDDSYVSEDRAERNFVELQDYLKRKCGRNKLPDFVQRYKLKIMKLNTKILLNCMNRPTPKDFTEARYTRLLDKIEAEIKTSGRRK